MENQNTKDAIAFLNGAVNEWTTRLNKVRKMKQDYEARVHADLQKVDEEIAVIEKAISDHQKKIAEYSKSL